MCRPLFHLLLLAFGAAIGGCAGAETGALAEPPLAATADHGRAQPAPVRAGLQQDGTYILNASELALNCRKLSGRTVVRILQIRDYELSGKSSVAAQQIQKVVAPVFGGTDRGADPDADYLRDRAIVEAYNDRLAEKGCKSFDLIKELQPKPAAESPVLVRR